MTTNANDSKVQKGWLSPSRKHDKALKNKNCVVTLLKQLSTGKSAEKLTEIQK